MASTKTIVIGASAGGVETLINLCRSLPADLHAAVLIVLHTPSTGGSLLPQILSRAGNLPAKHAQHEEDIEPGNIYVAPPNHHMLLNKNRLYLSRGPRENGHRPSVDSLFRSAAKSHGAGVIGIILSGTLGDGSMGLLEVNQAGGTTIVQDPQEALFSGMPSTAIKKTKVDFVLPLAAIAAKIIELVANDTLYKEVDYMEQNEFFGKKQLQEDKEHFKSNGKSSPRTLFTCPECGGVLWEMQQENALVYRCQIGHQFSEESLGVSQANSVETALWAAVRLLDERIALSARMANRAKEQGMDRSEKQFRDMEEDASRTAAIIRNLITNGHVVVPVLPPEVMEHNSAGSESDDRIH
jgi:two-component system, chemotaxis family, protein-glutamate methylesterase/glutaminase